MTAIPDNKGQLLAKTRKTVPLRLTQFNGKNTEKVILELQKAVQDLQFALREIQEFQFASRNIDSSGFPADKSRCEILDGQWLQLRQTTGAGQIVTVQHGLGRIPQGILVAVSSAQVPQLLLTGSGSVAAADKKQASFRLNGSAGDLSVVALF